MKFTEHIDTVIKSLERSTTKGIDSCRKIYQHTVDLKTSGASLFQLVELMKQFENITYLMSAYLTKNGIYDSYGGRGAANKDWNYNNLG